MRIDTTRVPDAPRVRYCLEDKSGRKRKNLYQKKCTESEGDSTGTMDTGRRWLAFHAPSSDWRLPSGSLFFLDLLLCFSRGGRLKFDEYKS